MYVFEGFEFKGFEFEGFVFEGFELSEFVFAEFDFIEFELLSTQKFNYFMPHQSVFFEHENLTDIRTGFQSSLQKVLRCYGKLLST